jgi:hypothetical protein
VNPFTEQSRACKPAVFHSIQRDQRPVGADIE